MTAKTAHATIRPVVLRHERIVKADPEEPVHVYVDIEQSTDYPEHIQLRISGTAVCEANYSSGDHPTRLVINDRHALGVIARALLALDSDPTVQDMLSVLPSARERWHSA